MPLWTTIEIRVVVASISAGKWVLISITNDLAPASIRFIEQCIWAFRYSIRTSSIQYGSSLSLSKLPRSLSSTRSKRLRMVSYFRDLQIFGDIFSLLLSYLRSNDETIKCLTKPYHPFLEKMDCTISRYLYIQNLFLSFSLQTFVCDQCIPTEWTMTTAPSFQSHSL